MDDFGGFIALLICLGAEAGILGRIHGRRDFVAPSATSTWLRLRGSDGELKPRPTAKSCS